MLILEHIVFYRIGQLLSLHLPLRVSYLLAILISDIRYIFAKVDRFNVTANLKIIFPDKGAKEIAQIRIEPFRNFAKYLVDFFRFPKFDLDYIKKNIYIKNAHYINEALSKGRGLIVLSAHIGNWELAGLVTAAICGCPVWAVALPHKDRRIDDFFNSQRIKKGVNIIPLGRAFRQCLDILKAGEIVGLMGERDFTERGIVLDFFGKPAFFPKGPAVLSLATGAPIVPTFLIRDGDGKFTLRFERPIEFKPTGNRESDVKELTLSHKVIIEDYIRKYPQQWYMFRKFWIE